VLILLTSTAQNKIIEVTVLSKSTNPFTIIVDTSCDLTQEFIKEHSIEVLSIPFSVNGEERDSNSWQQVSTKEFYDTLRTGGIAKTSQINPDAFATVFTENAKQNKDVLCLVLSSGLSSTYQNSMNALDDVKKSYPNCSIYPIDSLSATSYNTLLAILAVKKREEGLSAKETAEWLEQKKHKVLGFFTVDDLMYLHRGGRLSKLSAIGGSLLGVKPILNIQPDGTLKLKGKARGCESSFKDMVKQLQRCINPDTVLDTVVITHTDCEADALKLADILKNSVKVNRVEIIMMGIVGSNVGPDAVTMSFESVLTREEYEKL